MKRKLLPVVAGAAALAALLAAGTASAATLDEVQNRGHLKCGVNTGLPGFSAPNQEGEWAGLDVDFCRSVAAAVLGDAEAVQFTPLTAKERFTALQSGAIDVLSRNTTWTLTRDADLGLDFVGTLYYDGQGFLVSTDLGIDSAEQLSGAAVCVISGTTTELNLADFFRSHDMEYKPVTFSTGEQTLKAFNAGRCDVLTSDTSQLAGLRTKLPDPSAAKVLPEVISKEPLGPSVREGDQQWSDIVQWTLWTLIRAEELGISSENVDEMMESDNPKVQRLLGVSGNMGQALGLPDDFGYQIVKQVGNYGEIFRRNVGSESPLGLERGLNALWTEGGLMYAPPLR